MCYIRFLFAIFLVLFIEPLNIDAKTDYKMTEKNDTLRKMYCIDYKTDLIPDSIAYKETVIPDQLYIGLSTSTMKYGLIYDDGNEWSIIIEPTCNRIHKVEGSYSVVIVEMNKEKYLCYLDTTLAVPIQTENLYNYKFKLLGTNKDGPILYNGFEVLLSNGEVIRTSYNWEGDAVLEMDSTDRISVCYNHQCMTLNIDSIKWFGQLETTMPNVRGTQMASWHIMELINDTTVIVKLPNKRGFALVDQPYNQAPRILLNSCSAINLIDSTWQYISFTKDDTLHFIYDLEFHRSYPINESAEYATYLSEGRNGPVFSIANTILIDLHGLHVKVEGAEVSIKDYSPDNGICITNECGSAYIKLSKLRTETILSLKIKDMAFAKFYLKNDTIEHYYPMVDIHIGLPYLADNPRLRQNVLYWISESINLELAYATNDFLSSKHLFVPKLKTKSQEMADYYANLLLQYYGSNIIKDQLWGGVFLAQAKCLMRSDDLITYYSIVDSSLGGGSGLGNNLLCISTFDTNTGQRLVLTDIIKKEYHHEMAILLRKLFGDGRYTAASIECSDEQLISSAVGMLPEGLQFSFSRHSFFQVGADFFLPYKDIEPWLIRRPQFVIRSPKMQLSNSSITTKKWIKKDPLMDDTDETPQYVNITDKRLRNNTIKWRSDDERDSKLAANINRGLNYKLGDYLLNHGKIEKAHEIFQWLVDKGGADGLGGENTRSFGRFLQSSNQLAELYLKRNQIELAENKCIDLINRLENTYSTETEQGFLHYVDATIILSRCSKFRNKMNEAVMYAKQTADILSQHIMDKIMTLPPHDRTAFWNHYKPWYLNTLPILAYESKDSMLLRSSYEAVLRGKGLLLNTEMAMRQAIQNCNDEEIKQMLTNRDRLVKEYNMLTTGVNSSSSSDYILKKEILREQLDMAEISLSNKSYAFEAYRHRLDVNMNQVATLLHANEVAIEFIDIDEGQDTAYYALVLRKDQQIPNMLRLCTASQLTQLESFDYFLTDYLYNLLWLPLMPLLDGVDTIYFSPSGIFHTTAIEYLPIDKEGHTIQDIYKMFRLSSTREIVFARDSKYIDEGIRGNGVLYGGLDYDVSEKDLKKNSQRNSLSEQQFSFISDFTRTANFKRSSVTKLKGALLEINDIKPFVKHIDKIDSVITVTGQQGTETSFKMISSKYPHLLHIATHGFYFTQEEIEQMKRNGFFNKLVEEGNDIEENELLRSGLLFAGANHILRGNKLPLGMDDGILTTKEIAMLDLTGLDMAVLSACQSGIGDISSEGVSGLQRGFKKAGVHSLLMSLWKVDDTATQLLMKSFYEHLSQNQDKRQALQLAQKQLKEYEGGKYDDPFFWAAFILLDGIKANSK